MIDLVQPIVQHPKAILLTPTIEVTDFGPIPDLASMMFASMRKYKGIGLAANQINDPRRVFITHVPGWPEMVFINPHITRTKGESTFEEGCLSVQSSTVWVPVKRADIVYITYATIKGNIRPYKASGLLGRCIQHEIDHLDGLTCLERTTK